jgi:hypothetical protein
LRWVIAAILAFFLNIAPISIAPAPATPTVLDLQTPEAVLRWINFYRAKPDPAGVPAAVKALSRLGGFKDPETSGAYVGFMAGVIAANPDRAEELIAKMFPLPDADQWAVVRAIAYSGHPQWQALLRKFANRMPSRRVMIDKYLGSKLPTLYQVSFDGKPSTWQALRSYVTFSKKPKEVALEPSSELLDTYWGVYFANATYRPISRIIMMAAWSKDDDSVDRLTLGSMAKYTLAANATRDTVLLAMLKRAREFNPKPTVAILDEIIEAAETVDTAKLRREALASIDDLRRKGPGMKRNISLAGQVGQGALALGCIAAAYSGQIELGLPCVVAGGVSSAVIFEQPIETTYRASGSGRSWNFTTLLVVPLPPSI